MERIFELYKNKNIYQDGIVGHICGYTDTHLLLAITEKTRASFRTKMKKDTFILPEYQEGIYRYTYTSESEVIRQLGNKLAEFNEIHIQTNLRNNG